MPVLFSGGNAQFNYDEVPFFFRCERRVVFKTNGRNRTCDTISSVNDQLWRVQSIQSVLGLTSGLSPLQTSNGCH